MNGYYEHANPVIRDQQDRARAKALLTVSTGRVRWSGTVGLHGGFVIHDCNGIDQRLCLTDAIAMHELHQAGVITLDRNGRVVHAQQKASA
jgi:hypothetical protein